MDELLTPCTKKWAKTSVTCTKKTGSKELDSSILFLWKWHCFQYLCFVKEFPRKFVEVRYCVTLKRILSGELHALLCHERKTWRSSGIESNAIFIKIRCNLCIQFLDPFFWVPVIGCQRCFRWFFGAGCNFRVSSSSVTQICTGP